MEPHLTWMTCMLLVLLDFLKFIFLFTARVKYTWGADKKEDDTYYTANESALCYSKQDIPVSHATGSSTIPETSQPR